jgi:ribosome-associated toxin RatA of RatAB toxin-antitoxin module
MLRRSALVARSAAHLFDIIEAAEHYPQFLPWCAGAQIVSRDDSVVSADIRVRWGGLKFEFRTRNPKQRPAHMAIHLEHGPFRRFEGEWRLKALADEACKVEFSLDCEFDSALMTRAAGPMFDRISDTLVDAFVQRALAVPATPVQDATLGAPAVGAPTSGGGDG